MTNAEIEEWALRILDALEAGADVEDSRVELKAEWITAQKAARRLAGHANAARGQAILWLIGADEDHGVVGCDNAEKATWWSQVQSEFDSQTPRFVDLHTTKNGLSVEILYFETDLAPFVVRNPRFGQAGESIQREVPWREGTAVRSATHEDLVRLLVPKSHLPRLATLDSAFGVFDEKGKSIVVFQARIYITPTDSLVIPFHDTRISAMLPGRHTMELVRFSPDEESYNSGPRPWASEKTTIVHSKTIDSTKYELLVYGPGVAVIKAQTVVEGAAMIADDLVVEIQLTPAGSDMPVVCQVESVTKLPENLVLNHWRFH